MGLLSLFTSAQIKNEDIPWTNRPGIYQHIADNLDAGGKLTATGEKLPDDDIFFKDQKLRWVAGGMDGAFAHHGGAGSAEKNAKKVAKLVKAISINGSTKSKVELYELLSEGGLLDFLDPSLEKIVESNVSIDPHLHNFARWLAFQSPDRGPVKFGIALLGLIRDPLDMDRIKKLGRHEEFTLFSVVAVLNTFDDAEKHLYELAKYVDGWGKIHVVERLSDARDEEVKQWLLLEGYKNNIMYEYLAYTAAVSGGLLEALQADKVSDELLESAGEIIEALLHGGPAEDISDYNDAADVIELYLSHLAKADDLKIAQFNILKSIEYYLEDEDTDWSALTQNGWTAAKHNIVLASSKELSGKAFWRERVINGLNTSDDQAFWEMKRAAGHMEIDLWPTLWQRINNDPLNTVLWFDVMLRVTEDDIGKVVALAENTIPLETIATGPADEMGFGDEYKFHQILDTVLQDLGKFPGHGTDLIVTGLQSPVTRNRVMAVKSIESWGLENASDDLIEAIKQAAKREPDEELKLQLSGLLE